MPRMWTGKEDIKKITKQARDAVFFFMQFFLQNLMHAPLLDEDLISLKVYDH